MRERVIRIFPILINKICGRFSPPCNTIDIILTCFNICGYITKFLSSFISTLLSIVKIVKIFDISLGSNNILICLKCRMIIKLINLLCIKAINLYSYS